MRRCQMLGILRPLQVQLGDSLLDTVVQLLLRRHRGGVSHLLPHACHLISIVAVVRFV